MVAGSNAAPSAQQGREADKPEDETLTGAEGDADAPVETGRKRKADASDAGRAARTSKARTNTKKGDTGAAAAAAAAAASAAATSTALIVHADAAAGAQPPAEGTGDGKQPRRWFREIMAVTTLAGMMHVPVWVTDDRAGAGGEGAVSLTGQVPTDGIVGTTPPASMAEPAPVAEGERPFECSHLGCGKRFADREGLRKHQRTHGPKEYVCNVCSKSFVESSKLKRHQLVHTGEKPFVCPYEGCDRSFSLDFNLRAHMRTHTGDRPYLCSFEGCEKRFAQSSNLKAHMSTHTKANIETAPSIVVDPSSLNVTVTTIAPGAAPTDPSSANV